MSTPNFRGSELVQGPTHEERTDSGVWLQVQEFTGMKDAVLAYAATLPLGVKISIRSDGPIATLSISGQISSGDGATDPVDKWETDTEILERDIALSPLASGLSDDGRIALYDYRTMSAKDRMAFSFADYDIIFDAEQQGILQDLFLEIDRGVETVPVSTIVLKCNRTIGIEYSPRLKPTVTQKIYSTAKLKDVFGVPDPPYSDLPTNGGDVPTPEDSAWAWLPRLNNRSYVGRGLIEESRDWVFAAWSTNLYTLVS